MTTIRALLVANYGFLTIAGVGMTIWAPVAITLEVGPVLTVILGVITALSAAVCTVAAARWLWRIEWVGLYTLGASVTGYGLVAAARCLAGSPELIVQATMLACLAGFLMIRLLTLAALNSSSTKAIRSRLRLDGEVDGKH